MRTVYQALNPIDAHLVKHALDDAGIPAFVLGEHLIGGMGELPATGFVEVRVPDDWYAEAEALLQTLPLVNDAAGPVEADEDDEGWLTE
ncbi:MAG: DUF2007 domain-containing protein [Xanthomonadaceae bacterium]|nr:DUF2007 domain-containing protein [Xanthomonadaceae bacterium]